MQRADSLEKTLMLGKIEGRRRRGRQRTRWLSSIIDSMHMNLSKLWEIVKDRGARSAEFYRVTKNQVWLSNWTTTTKGGRIGVSWDWVPYRTQRQAMFWMVTENQKISKATEKKNFWKIKWWVKTWPMHTLNWLYKEKETILNHTDSKEMTHSF